MNSEGQFADNIKAADTAKPGMLTEKEAAAIAPVASAFAAALRWIYTPAAEAFLMRRR